MFYPLMFIALGLIVLLGFVDQSVRAITFVLDNTRGMFARILVAIAAALVGALLVLIALPFFTGELNGAGHVVAYLIRMTPVFVIFAAAGFYFFYRPAPNLERFWSWLSDQFNSRHDR